MPRLYGIALVVFLKDMQGKVDMIGCKSVKCVIVCLCIFALYNIHIYIYKVYMTDMACKVRSTVVAANLSAAKQRKIDAKHSR